MRRRACHLPTPAEHPRGRVAPSREEGAAHHGRSRRHARRDPGASPPPLKVVEHRSLSAAGARVPRRTGGWPRGSPPIRSARTSPASWVTRSAIVARCSSSSRRPTTPVRGTLRVTPGPERRRRLLHDLDHGEERRSFPVREAPSPIRPKLPGRPRGTPRPAWTCPRQPAREPSPSSTLHRRAPRRTRFGGRKRARSRPTIGESSRRTRPGAPPTTSRTRYADRRPTLAFQLARADRFRDHSVPNEARTSLRRSRSVRHRRPAPAARRC